MDLKEYKKVEHLNYREYCDYLQEKYGIGLSAYFRPSWTKNQKVSRTKEGLLVHHKYEDHAIKLSEIDYAKKNPYEWQLAENLIYCDYLEHLYLHILICENPAKNKNPDEVVGIGGIIDYIVPELNDVYSGWKTEQDWRKNIHDRIKINLDVYLTLLKRFKTTCSNYPNYTDKCLLKSFSTIFPTKWFSALNQELYETIKNL